MRFVNRSSMTGDSIDRRAGLGGFPRVLVAVALLTLLSACRTTAPSGPGPDGIELEGTASWYGPEFAGRPTANGEIFDPQTMTAAHRTLPFGTIVDVTNLKNGRTTRVRINDRGPFVGNRIIDLSYAAARSLDMVEDGVSKVRLDIVQLGRGDREPPTPYSVTIDSKPTRPVPEVAATPEPEAPLPSPEPVRTIDEDPVEVTEMQVEATTPVTATPVPVAPPPRVEAPPSTAPRDTRGWKVQIGAFGVEQNARRLAQELAARVSSVYVEAVSGLHRVRVGPFASKTEAIDVAELIHGMGYEAIVLSPDAR